MMKTKHLALCSILTAIALTIFVAEQQIPVIIPIPGIKLGLSNIITLFALIFLSPKEAFGILFARILLGSFFTGNPSTLIYRFSGGIICFIAEWLLLKLFSDKYIKEISAVGAIIHNITQLTVAGIVLKTSYVFYYFPYLLIAGIVTGYFTGVCVWFLQKSKAMRKFF